MKKSYIIAEVGVNFFDTAKELQITPLEAAVLYIDGAKEGLADAVKFQSYKAETIVSKDSPAYWDLNQEPTKTQYELFKKHDSFSENEYKELYEYSKSKGIDFLSTPFDLESIEFLDKYCDVYKISSSDLNNDYFLEEIAKKNKKILLSTGASYISEIEKAVRIIRGINKDIEICLLHCVLSYPTSNKDANLLMIEDLKRIFNDLEIGYSDHTMPDVNSIICPAAYLLGATVIEKHFTLNKELPGNDHYHAGDIEDFKKMRANFNVLEEVLGSRSKTVLECESNSRIQARRSLVAKHDLKPGDIISKENIILKRPGTGISVEFFYELEGKVITKDIKEDEIITWDKI